MYEFGPYPLRVLVDQWYAKIKLSLRIKHERFGKYAEETANFYDGPINFMWDRDYSSGQGGFLQQGEEAGMPRFRMSSNRAFDAVAMFGPALYHNNPNVLVEPRMGIDVSPMAMGMDPNDPMQMEQYQALTQQEQMRRQMLKDCAEVKSAYLNWLQDETDKKTQSRRAITEAFTRGLGLLWVEMYQPPGSQFKMPRSRYVCEKDFTVDPDADYWEDVQWCARRTICPVNLAEKKFGHEPGTLKGNMESANNQAEMQASNNRESWRKRHEGQSFDLIEYWEIWSKNGIGDKLKLGTAARDARGRYQSSDGAMGKVTEWAEEIQAGDYCYLAIAQGVPFPLNVPPDLMNQPAPEPVPQEDGSVPPQQPPPSYLAIQWPVPYWYDASCGGGWPFARLYFYDKPGDVWPVPFLKPVIGELRFINWCMSFMADKVAASCRNYIAINKDAAENIREQLLDNDGPFPILELSQILGRNINEVVSFLSAPEPTEAIWKMIMAVGDRIDKATGLTELIYGLTGTQMRSATEANVRNQNLSIRPDDMAAKTEDWLSEVNAREMQAARWFCDAHDVLGAVGPLGAQVWQTLVMTSDIESVVRDYDYTVAAGTARKPNKEAKQQALTAVGQVIAPMLQTFAQMGMTQPYNAYASDLIKSHDLDPAPYLLPPFQPPQQDAAAQGPSPEEEAQHREDAHSQSLRHAEEKHQQHIVHTEEKAEVANKVTKDKGEVAVKNAKAKAKSPKKKD
jgi:hypothetical protein